ncbi:hypothetical protein SBE55_10325 [Mycolicibacterium sp. 141076]|uniref:hypothetical protein n=1 Tax=Mycolicibacterium sp. 141076 TaxID=3090599 RepID=UPI00299EB6F2|nr:hypothetical protein [Mycolicibacterium sp. 141076]MDX1878213.1 hypothetical protein [Mycolicibacterium sp. 141076]
MTHLDQQVTCTGDVWCAHHAGDCPPADTIDTALKFDGAANMIALAIEDVEKAQNQLPVDAGLWDHVDLVRAARHLRAAAQLVDTVADRIDAPVVAK